MSLAASVVAACALSTCCMAIAGLGMAALSTDGLQPAASAVPISSEKRSSLFIIGKKILAASGAHLTDFAPCRTLRPNLGRRYGVLP